MAANDILEFAENATNILSDAQYATDTERDLGSQSGDVARSEINNKALKQSTLVASGVSQFVADNQATDINDSLSPVDYATALSEAIGSGGAFVTEPQFTNDSSVATTEFIQRAVGSNSSAELINSGTYSITADDIGAVLNPVVACTFTLPLISTLNAAGATGLGSKIKIQNDSLECTINAQSPDTINSGLGGLALTFVTLAPYESIEFSIVDGATDGEWVITGGSAQVGNTAGFENQLTLNGYQKLPGGLIIQWGQENSVSRNEVRIVNFPIAFPGSVLNLSSTVKREGGGLGTQNMYSQTLSNTQFKLTHDADDSGSADDAFWIALGL